MGLLNRYYKVDIGTQCTCNKERSQALRNIIFYNSTTIISMMKTIFSYLDQVSASIHQEWKRLQRRKHLRAPCPSSPEMSTFSSYSPGSSPPRKDQPLFTLKQVTLICERMLKERETQVTEEYDKVLREKLAGV